MQISTGRCVVPGPDGAMTLHVARPAPPPAGVIAAAIVLQEAFGVDAHIRDLRRRFAQAGYLAVAPELYSRRGRSGSLGAHAGVSRGAALRSAA